MKKIITILGVSLVVIILVIIVGMIGIVSNQKVSDKKALAMADTSSEALLLDKLIQSQNKIADCIDEIAKVWQRQGFGIAPEIIEKTKKCKSSVRKDVTKINGDIYLVAYIQYMPEGCGSDKTVQTLLKIEVNIGTKKTIGTWKNGTEITFSDMTIQNIEKSLEFKDCESYAQYIGPNGTMLFTK